MNSLQALQTTARALNLNSIENSHHEARILLQHVLNLSPTELYAWPERTLNYSEIRHLQQLVKRRLLHEPNAYIVRHKEFYGSHFYVDPRVLIPRPETELLVEVALSVAKDHTNCLPGIKKPFLIADIGTGSGAIAVSLALHLPASKIYAIDISTQALEIARLNCEYHSVSKQVFLIHGNLLESLPEPVDLLIANPPYIRCSDLAGLIPEIANFEPRIALDGGQDGLECIRRLAAQIEGRVHSRGCILLEIGDKQENKAITIVKRYLPKARYELASDLNGIARVIKIAL